jgi:uncharacterized protein (DUF433 family)
MRISERIIIDRKICNGKPVIKGTRITVQAILEFLVAGDSPRDIIEEYPSLKAIDIHAALKFATIQLGRDFTNY